MKHQTPLISLPSTIKVLQDGTLSLVSTDGLEPPDRKKPVFTKVALRRLKAEFEQGSGAALLHLATACLNKPLPVELGWLRSYAEQFLFAYCHHAARTTRSARFPVTPPTSTQLQSRIDAAPPVPGAEYLTPDVLLAWWQQLIDAMRVKGGRSPIKWLEEAEPQWCGAGRVRFLLKENKKNKEFPFEFIASYIDGVSVKDGIRYIAIPSAVKKKARKRDDKQLMSLLVPLERAASQLPWLRQVMDSGDIHRSLRLTSQQALEYLNSLGTLQQAGIAVSYPKWWHPDRPPRPKVKVTLGSNKGKGTGIDRLLEMTIGVSLADKPVVAKALRDALKTQDDNPGMVRFNGHWVDLDAQRLGGVLTQLHKAQTVSNKGIPFGQAQRLLAGADYFHAEAAGHDALGGSTMLDLESGAWLNTTLVRMNNPEKIGGRKVAGMRVRLRPYQYHGVHWLRYLGNLQLGACLADDMGLGKTVQVLALLLDLRNSQRRQRPASAQKNTRKKAGQSKRIHAATPSLLVVPASLIANWLAEARRFTPGLQIVVLHNSECKFSLGDDKVVRREIRHADLVITSYGMLRKLDVLQRLQWRWLILDEAQNIRNPQSAQTKAVKTLKSANRLALTGTPVENSLSDLWSIMDFLNPGLLGTQAEFSQFIKRLETGRGSSTGFIESTQSGSHYAPLRKLVSPYLLRRLKTDKRIISDLPDKTEVTRYCTLSKQQVKLYRDAIKSLKKELREVEGIKRRGLVLAYLTRFKQICNHPAQWQKTGDYDASESGKFQQLGNILETLATRQERLLVFTQFREMTRPLADLLEDLYGSSGLVLHGGTAVKRRQAMVDEFQQVTGPPFMVLSLKAGGTGLNLTAASHVIHFDRWWNPAVENQATDRAYRIGQKQNVVVHKFVCRGTIEEKIERMISDKMALANAVIDQDAAESLTEMTDKELLDFVALDTSPAAD